MTITGPEKDFYDGIIETAEHAVYDRCAWCGDLVQETDVTLTLATRGHSLRETVLFCSNDCRDEALQFFPPDDFFS